jgi:CHAT domain-containing protein
LAAFQFALELIREFENPLDEIEALANLGHIHQALGESGPALAHYRQAVARIEQLRNSISSADVKADFTTRVAHTYAHTVLLCVAAGEAADAFGYVERAKAQAFLEILTTRQTGLPAAQVAAPMTLAQVQASLPADGLLLEYFTTGLEEERLERRLSQQGIQRHRFPPAGILLLAVTSDTIRIISIDLPPNSLRPRHVAGVVERHFLAPQIRRTLYERLLAPVEELLPGKHRIYLAPHGPLHYVPFAALIDGKGETLLPANGAAPQLVYGPSASALFRPPPTQQLAERRRAQQSCLALGYNGQGAAELHFAEEEAQRVARLTGGQTLIGPGPKKAQLVALAGAYRMLHFSCHGLFDPEAPLASALQLAEDEYLTAQEVLAQLHLRSELVVLSACESGLSHVRRGDELVGFVRAFLLAGTPTLIATLWRVDERSTRLLMERFYRLVHEGASFAAALAAAQQYLRGLTLAGLPEAMRQELAAHLPTAEPETQVFADPFYWAPFILAGDPGKDQAGATGLG